jgi:TetR/AcrR family fatty acid metabolism transcriptional regulator
MARTPRAQTDKRERILAGAIEAFAARGFHRTRVSDVARAAGVADGTIYLYFRNKNELLATIFETTLERFWERGHDVLWRDDDPAGQLKRLVHLHLSFMGEDRRLASVFQVDLRNSLHFLGGVTRRILRGHMERVAGIVQRGQQAGIFAADVDPLTAAGMVFGVLDEMTTAWVSSRRNYRLESQIPLAQAFVLRALAVP